MDLFDYLRSGKINTFEEPFMSGAKVTDYIANGSPDTSPFHGLLGMKKKLDQITAAKFSDTSIFTLLDGVYRLVRSDPTIAVVGNWTAGRPVFWVDKRLYKVSTVAADATAEFAGVALGPLTKAGSFKIIQVSGEAPGLYAAALTKAAPAINDPLVLKFAANLADFDVELDATAHANAIVKRLVGRVDEAAVAGAVKRVFLNDAHEVQNRGIFT